MLAMFMTSLLIGYLVLGSLPIAVLGTIGATIADGVSLKVLGIPVDDNFTIPLFSGMLMSCGSMW
jgi:dolichol kinase